MASQEFEQFPDCAMPLVTVGDANEFVLNEDAVALLQMLTCPVCPIAIAGLYRTGKSSLLNWLLDRPGGFKVVIAVFVGAGDEKRRASTGASLRYPRLMT